MHNRKVKALLSVLLVLCVFLPSFSSLSSAADINASAFSSRNSEVVSMYYLGSGGVIEERYSVLYGDLISSLPSTFTIPYDYNDANRKATFITLDLTFTDDKKFYNTDYRLQFKTSAQCNAYSYIFNLPDTYTNDLLTSDIILSQTAIAFNTAYTGRDVGDIYRYPVTMNNDIVAYFNSSFGSSFTNNITMGYGVSDSTNKFTCDFHIPQNQTMLYYPKVNSSFELVDATPAPRTLRICLYIYQSSGTQTSLKISDLTLIPINGTEQYYQDEVFQNDVIGSDDEGNESGLKGIISFLKSLISVLIGSDEPGNESGFLGVIALFKNLPQLLIDKLTSFFVPSEEFLSNTYQEFDQFLSEHLGVFYQAPKLLIELIQYFVELDAPFFENVGDYKLKMPVVTLYVNSDPPTGYDYIYSNLANDYQVVQKDLSSYVKFDILTDNSIGEEEDGFYLRLDFLEKRPYSGLYDVYRVFSYSFVIVIFLLYCYRRLNAVLGGVNE